MSRPVRVSPCPVSDPHDGPHGYFDDEGAAQCCDGVPAVCLWCGKRPAAHVILGDPVCGPCHDQDAAEVPE